MADNELFQYSIVSALMDGVASHGISIPELLSHGDHGLGTFRFMVGEMIILDGKVYQMKSDGTVTTVDPDAAALSSVPDTSSSTSSSTEQQAVAPFAMITRFQPSTTITAAVPSKQALSDLLTTMLPHSRNHYVALRADGAFRSVTVRTVGGQDAPGEALAAVGARQTSHELRGVRGTVVGFRSPAYMQGVSVAGDHLHFVSADRGRGGHLLACESDGAVEVAAAPVGRLVLELPRSDAEFDAARLQRDAAGIAAVEG